MKKCTGIIVYEKNKKGYIIYTASAISVSGSVTSLAVKKNMYFNNATEVINFIRSLYIMYEKLEVKNLTSPRSGCAIANQFIIFDYTNGIITFQSYTSCIADYNMNTKELVLYPKYNYSRTTSKYLYQFLKEYTDCNITNKKELEEALKNGVIQLVEK